MTRQQLDPDIWKRLYLTWVDERCVPFGDPQSNRGSAYGSGVLDAKHPVGLELPLYLDDEGPQEACQRVEWVLSQDFQEGLDILLLGMGEEGHIASIFPSMPAQGGPPPSENLRFITPSLVLVYSVLNSPKPPPQRITLALSFLERAGETILVAAGESKRRALEELKAGNPNYPATHLKNLRVFTDLPELAEDEQES